MNTLLFKALVAYIIINVMTAANITSAWPAWEINPFESAEVLENSFPQNGIPYRGIYKRTWSYYECLLLISKRFFRAFSTASGLFERFLFG